MGHILKSSGNVHIESRTDRGEFALRLPSSMAHRDNESGHGWIYPRFDDLADLEVMLGRLREYLVGRVDIPVRHADRWERVATGALGSFTGCAIERIKEPHTHTVKTAYRLVGCPGEVTVYYSNTGYQSLVTSDDGTAPLSETCAAMIIFWYGLSWVQHPDHRPSKLIQLVRELDES